MIKAYFEVDRYPVQGQELLLHRYEGVVNPTQANYRYFVAGQVGGMLLSTLGQNKTPLKGSQLLAFYPLETDNREEPADTWIAIPGNPSFPMREAIFIKKEK